jgi:hypothetical protein
MHQARLSRGGALALAALLAALIAVFVFTPRAEAVIHTYNQFQHGLTDNKGSPTTSQYLYRAWVSDVDGDLYWAHEWAYGYHYTSTGEWQNKCWYYADAAHYTWCDFEPGNYPCQKWAYTAGDDITGGDSTWHGHQAEICS